MRIRDCVTKPKITQKVPKLATGFGRTQKQRWSLKAPTLFSMCIPTSAYTTPDVTAANGAAVPSAACSSKLCAGNAPSLGGGGVICPTP